MNGLSREEYLKRLKELSAIVNPKPSKKERDKYLEDIQRQREARKRTQRLMKELKDGAKHA